MVTVWNEWVSQHDVKPILSEATVWSNTHGYAGTLDGVWEVDGVRYLLDVKSSRNIFDEHRMQISALANADVVMVETEPDVWVEAPMEQVAGYAVLRIRPRDVDKDGNVIEPYCRLDILDATEMPTHFEAFKGLLGVAKAQMALKELRKENEKSTDF
jgi:hypothetical protein